MWGYSVLVVSVLVVGTLGKSALGPPLLELEKLVDALKDGNKKDVDLSARSTPADFINEVIADHNRMRAIHQVDELTEDPALTAKAQAWADHLAETGKFKHNPDKGVVGENIAYTTWPNRDGAYFSQMWYNEVQFYDAIYGRNLVDFNEFYKVGHFTQLVWKGTEKIGVGRATQNGRTFVVANYYPPGNYWNQFDVNVLEPMF